ncbi:tetratricopeptide repeat protein [Cysteiniphilum sp. 6C5]|uniref:tetratricopeptide repeat protein n=1 Tax=unclassified Cysteiniphilum TaxID=2610889 RepID=UPI003F82CA83
MFLSFKKTKSIGIGIGILAIALLPSVNFASVESDVQALQLQTTKLNNQVQYLINQQANASNQDFSQTLADLRGKIEVNSYKISQLNDVVSTKLAAFEKELESLKAEVNKPSPKELKLQQDNAAFDKANKALLAKNYKEAEQLFKQYLKAYYNGEHYSESLYLLGQIYLIDGNIDDAYAQFKTIVTRYPKSIKIADATYALALLELSKGNTKTASTYLKRVVDKYPYADVADKAKTQLAKLK